MSDESRAATRFAIDGIGNFLRFVLTPRQLRAARALIGWSQQALSKASGVPTVTIGEFEGFKTGPRLTTIGKLRRALERAGVRFIDTDDDGGPGVRLKQPEEPQEKPAKRRSRAGKGDG